MEHISSYQAIVYQMCISYLAGRMLTIFFKRKFSFKVHTRRDVLDVLPVFIASFFVQRGSVGPVLGIAALLSSNILHIHDEMVKTLCLWISLHLAVYAQFSELTFACLALFCATTQFLRKPDWLKNALREPRVIFGPIYVFMVCAGLRFFDDGAHIFPTIFTLLASFCSVLAAVVFRPDNNETIRLILPESWTIPTTQKRQVIHGCLLFASFVVTFLKVLWLDPSLLYKPVVVCAVLNIFMYLSYKIISRRR